MCIYPQQESTCLAWGFFYIRPQCIRRRVFGIVPQKSTRVSLIGAAEEKTVVFFSFVGQKILQRFLFCVQSVFSDLFWKNNIFKLLWTALNSVADISDKISKKIVVRLVRWKRNIFLIFVLMICLTFRSLAILFKAMLDGWCQAQSEECSLGHSNLAHPDGRYWVYTLIRTSLYPWASDTERFSWNFW